MQDILRKYYPETYTHYAALVYDRGEKKSELLGENSDRHTVFDLASLTKTLVTTQLIFEKIADGSLHLEAEIGDYLDQAGRAYFSDKLCNFKISDLLRHHSGLPAWRNFWVNHVSDLSMAHDRRLDSQRWKFIAEHCQGSPVTGCYSDVGFILLGQFIERLENKRINKVFSAFCERHDLIPPNLANEFGFSIDHQQFSGRMIASTGYCCIRGRHLSGEVHDENAASFGGLCGHAGLFGSLAALKEYFLNLQSTELFSCQLRHCAKLSEKTSYLYGWRLGSGASSKNYRQGKSYGHLGFTGTSLWFDPASDINLPSFQVLLTNRVISSRVNPEFSEIRSLFSGYAEQFFHQKA